MRTPIAFSAAALFALTIPAAVQAQPRGVPAISVGRISSERTCTLYRESAGRSAMVATPYTVAAASSWRTWLVRDCVDNFPTLRTSLQAALASSGKLSVRQSGGAVLTARISDITGGGAEPSADTARDGFAAASNFISVSTDVTITDPSGRIVFGQLVTKKLETGSDIDVDGFRATSSEAGRGLYARLQHEVAIAVARKVSFRLVPLEVVSGGGRTIQLNYGSPLLTLGTTVMVTSPDGRATVRYNVTSASDNSATAEVDGEGDVGRIVQGATGVVIEADDPAANGRRMKRVDLP